MTVYTSITHRADVDRYMPKFLLRRYKRDYKVRKKLEEVFECFAKLDVDSSHYVQKFLDVFEKDEMCGHHVFPLKKVELQFCTKYLIKH